MDYRSLVAKLEAISNGVPLSEASAPTTFTPTHFHKGNLGNKNPIMQTPDGQFWWETTQSGEGGGGTVIAPWQGDTLNRSGWNPASIDGVIKDGKYIDFPEGVNWKQFKEKSDSDTAAADLLAKLKKLIELIDQYNALKAKKKGGATTAPTTGQNPNIDDATRQRAQASVAGLKEGLMESFGYEAQTDEGFGAAATKVLGRAAPGVGAVLGAQGAVDSYKKGDYLGAALNGLSGAFSLVPGLGWIPALGLGLWQAGREISGAADQAGQPAAQQGANPTGKDPKVLALQQKLIQAGAQIKADGIMGPKTQAAMQQFPNIKEGEEMNQQKSLAESIRELQQRLAMIETEEVAPAEPAPEPATGEENSLAKQLEQAGGKLMEKDGRQFMVIPEKGIAVEIPSMEIVDASTPALTPTGKQFDPAALGLSEGLEEGIWDSIVKGAVNVGRGIANQGKSFASGLKGSGATTFQNAKTGRFAGGAKGANKVGKVIGKNPLKTGAAVGAAGLGLGLAGGAGGGANPTATPSQGGGAATPNVMPELPAEDDADMKALRAQIDALIAELSKSQDPAIQKGLLDAKAKLGQ